MKIDDLKTMAFKWNKKGKYMDLTDHCTLSESKLASDTNNYTAKRYKQLTIKDLKVMIFKCDKKGKFMDLTNI